MRAHLFDLVDEVYRQVARAARRPSSTARRGTPAVEAAILGSALTGT
jgi:hypothetical protein